VASVTEADAGDDLGISFQLSHRPGILQAVRQWLLTQDMFASPDQVLGDLTMQCVRHDDRHDVYIVSVHDVMPVSYCSFVAITVAGTTGEGLVRVTDGSEPYRGYPLGSEHGPDLAPGVGVRSTSHTGSDDGHRQGMPLRRGWL